MVAYPEFVPLKQLPDSEARGRAAYTTAMAFVGEEATVRTQAALYSALVEFLDDPSVKVRAALAYGLLHSPHAPRPIILSLLRDSAVISRAVVQYSPVLVDADLMGLLGMWDDGMLLAAAQRDNISKRLAGGLVVHGGEQVRQRLLRRLDVPFEPSLLVQLATETADSAEMRGALLARPDLPATARLLLVHTVAERLKGARIVNGALAPDRLERLLRNSSDMAVSAIGEEEANNPATEYVSTLVSSDRINTRLLLHAMVNGHVLFLAECIAALAQISSSKVFALLESGSRTALNALFGRCGLTAGVASLMTRLVLHARAADLSDDHAARHFVVTALTEELLEEHGGLIPEELEEAFSYLSEQNISLARHAARGSSSALRAAPSEVHGIELDAADRLLPAA
jgi:uncharacterized protein (DUF2336 family)